MLKGLQTGFGAPVDPITLRAVSTTVGRNSPKNGRTRGYGTATKATAKIEAAVPKIVEKELARIVSKTLGS